MRNSTVSPTSGGIKEESEPTTVHTMWPQPTLPSLELQGLHRRELLFTAGRIPIPWFCKIHTKKRELGSWNVFTLYGRIKFLQEGMVHQIRSLKKGVVRKRRWDRGRGRVGREEQSFESLKLQGNVVLVFFFFFVAQVDGLVRWYYSFSFLYSILISGELHVPLIKGLYFPPCIWSRKGQQNRECSGKRQEDLLIRFLMWAKRIIPPPRHSRWQFLHESPWLLVSAWTSNERESKTDLHTRSWGVWVLFWRQWWRSTSGEWYGNIYIFMKVVELAKV